MFKSIVRSITGLHSIGLQHSLVATRHPPQTNVDSFDFSKLLNSLLLLYYDFHSQERHLPYCV